MNITTPAQAFQRRKERSRDETGRKGTELGTDRKETARMEREGMTG